MKAFLILLALVSFLPISSFGAISVNADIKGNASQIVRIQRILPGLESIVNSEEFKAKILAATFTSTAHKPDVIYQTLTKSAWHFKLEFKLQRNWLGKCPVLGWTYAKVQTIWINTCNFDGRTDSGIAGTLAHEMTHKLGYGHKSAKDYMSVPYSVGNLVAEMYEAKRKK